VSTLSSAAASLHLSVQITKSVVHWQHLEALAHRACGCQLTSAGRYVHLLHAAAAHEQVRLVVGRDELLSVHDAKL
jgi:hypothetical protein